MFEYLIPSLNLPLSIGVSNDEFPNTTKTNPLIIINSNKSVYRTDEKVLVYGNARNGTESLNIFPITVEALQNKNTLYRNTTITDNAGNFHLAFYITQEGNTEIRAKLQGNNTDIENLYNITMKNPQWRQILGIAVPIGSIITTFIILWSFYPRYQRILIPVAIGMAAFAGFYFYIFSPLDTLSNAAVIAALLAPLAPYIYETMRSKRDAISGIEETVGKYRNESITEDVKNLLNVHEELSQHMEVLNHS